jgi:hypothetical protein
MMPFLPLLQTFAMTLTALDSRISQYRRPLKMSHPCKKRSPQDGPLSIQRWHLLTTAMFIVLMVLTGNAVNAQPLDLLIPLSPAGTLALRSQTGDTPTSIVFMNESGRELAIYWVNYAGQPVFYRFLDPGDFYVQQTYLTHPWMIYDQATELPIEGFLPIAREAVALVDSTR